MTFFLLPYINLYGLRFAGLFVVPVIKVLLECISFKRLVNNSKNSVISILVIVLCDFYHCNTKQTAASTWIIFFCMFLFFRIADLGWLVKLQRPKRTPCHPDTSCGCDIGIEFLTYKSHPSNKHPLSWTESEWLINSLPTEISTKSSLPGGEKKMCCLPLTTPSFLNRACSKPLCTQSQDLCFTFGTSKDLKSVAHTTEKKSLLYTSDSHPDTVRMLPAKLTLIQSTWTQISETSGQAQNAKLNHFCITLGVTLLLTTNLIKSNPAAIQH